MDTPRPRRRTRLVVLVVVLVVVLLAVAGAAVYFRDFRTAQAAGGALAASGTIETTQVNVSPEVGGRVLAVNFQEGDPVHAGDLLVQFDPTLLQAQRKQAAAALAAAQANYASLQSGAANQQLQAAVAQAQMQVLAAQQAISDLNDQAALAAAQANQAVAAAQSALTTANKDLRNAQNPAGQALFDTVDHTKLALDTAQNGDLLSTVSPDAQALVGATAQVNILFSKYQNLQAKWDAGDHGDQLHTALQLAQSAYQSALDTKTQLELRIQSDKANRDQSVKDAQKVYTDAVNNLSTAQRGPDADKLALAQANAKLAQAALTDAQARAAKLGSGPDPAQLALAQARVAAAQASLQAAQAALAPAQLDAAQAQVDTAQAALELLDAQLAKLVVTAPADGVILSRAIEPGEVASPGATLMVMGPLTELRVTVYVPEDRYGQIRLGQTAQLRVDSFPGRVFEGKVLQIANQAEFTPRNSQTVSGRKDTVFAVRLSFANPDQALKPGMPADVTFTP
jgi:HlyD family secretion protein